METKVKWGTFVATALLAMGVGLYLAIAGSFQPNWIPFMQTVATISSLLVTFAGLMYVNATNSVKESKRGFWELEENNFSLVTKMPVGRWPNKEELARMQEDFKEVSRLFGHIREVTKLMGEEIRNILVLWATSVIGALFVLLVSSATIPVVVAFVVSVFALFIQAIQFGLFTWRTNNLLSLETTDAKVASVEGVLNEAERRLNTK